MIQKVIGEWSESDLGDWKVIFMIKWENFKWIWFWLKMGDKLVTPREYECLVWVSFNVNVYSKCYVFTCYRECVVFTVSVYNYSD